MVEFPKYHFPNNTNSSLQAVRLRQLWKMTILPGFQLISHFDAPQWTVAEIKFMIQGNNANYFHQKINLKKLIFNCISILDDTKVIVDFVQSIWPTSGPIAFETNNQYIWFQFPEASNL